MSRTTSKHADLLALVSTPETVTSALALNPTKSISSIAHSLYPKPNILKEGLERLKISHHHAKTATEDEDIGGVGESEVEDLDWAAKCGKWGEAGRPSDLFLGMYAAALSTLVTNPLVGVVSPPLLGSSGQLPLSIISVIPDIMKCMASLIVNAKKEVFLATNFWVSSKSSKIITEAMLELSKRVVERGGEKIIFKLMYDRGSPEQITDNHLLVPESKWTSPEVQLPAKKDIPGIELEVINYHRPAVGTFHAKYMVVDGTVGILNSNNIQDRCNMEMMTLLRGPIVKSLYDMALISWAKVMTPMLPCVLDPTFGVEEAVRFGEGMGFVGCVGGLDQIHGEKDVGDISEEGRLKAICEHLNCDLQPDTHPSLPPSSQYPTSPFTPFIFHSEHPPVPIAMVNREPIGTPGHGHTVNPQDAAWLAGMRLAKKTVFIQTPTFNALPMVHATLAAIRRGIRVILYADIGFNDEGEELPYQGGTNEDVVEKMYKELNEAEKELFEVYWYTGKDMDAPTPAKIQKRNCHVKLMIVDEEVGIQGNGNQDSQSWYHSQEINIMIQSPLHCREWMQGIKNNQNTHLYGKLDKDGKWRDSNGNTLPGASGASSGPFKSLKGIQGAIKRVQGKGGF